MAAGSSMAKGRSNCTSYQTLKGCRDLAVDDGGSGSNVASGSISDLPDDIITQILSRLTLKDAVATSLLSRRWRYSWTSLPTLNLVKSEDPSAPMDAEAFCGMVNQVLRLHRLPPLRELSICHPLNVDYGRHIESWLAFAAASGVSRFAVDFIHDFVRQYCIPIDLFEDLHWIESNLELFYGIYSPSHDIAVPSLAPGAHFKSLRELKLEGVDFGDDVFEAILSRCSILECLVLSMNNKLIKPKYFEPLPRLRRLEMYCFHHLESLEISAPSLVSFTYVGRLTIDIRVKDAQHLAELALIHQTYLPRHRLLGMAYQTMDDLVTQFDTYLSGLEYLTMNVNFCLTMGSRLLEIPVFSKLKTLSLWFGIWRQYYRHVVVWFINASPLLQRLDLVASRDAGIDQPERNHQEFMLVVPLCPHGKLKKISVDDSCCDLNFLEFVEYIVRYTPALEKIEMKVQDYPSAGKGVDLLHGSLPPNAQLVLHHQ